MEIRWLGRSTFEIKSSVGVVVVDHEGALPSDSELEDENTIFVFSQKDRSEIPLNDYHVLTGPGEYEIGGISIRGIASPADDPSVSKEINTVYAIVTDGLHVVSLGTPGKTLSAQSIQQIARVDVLLVNTANHGLESEDLASVVRSLEPKVVVPTGFDTASSKPSAELGQLLTELGVKEYEPVARLNVTKSNLPEERQVVVVQQL